MTDNPAIDIPTLKNGRRNLFAAVIVLAIVAGIAATLLLSRRAEAPTPGDEINVPRMQNVPPPSQRLQPKRRD